jgi:putative membrane-bound dehydrogenase-like protein
MSRFLSLCLFLGLTPFVNAQTPPPTTSVKLNGHTFTLPEGFTIEVAAKAPLVDRPVSAALDEQGRLYVTISSGSNERGPAQAEKKLHHVVRLEDTDQDGVYDRATVFADKVAMPQGALWYQGSLYVAAPPHILKLTETDKGGKADRREIWFDGKTVTGCMNDLHGPWLGPDGWIYWTKGAFAPQTYTIHGKEWKTRAAHVFRARPDGTGIEPLMTGGMDNPVGLAFTPSGDRIVSGTFYQFPGDGKRDGLLHAVYGGIFGKDWDVIHDPQHKWTSPNVLPIMTHLGAAAPCGMIRFESAQFGKDYQDNLFCCLFNLQKVMRHVLIPDGASYKTRDFDFVVSDQKDFHPTDVVEAPDGSLLIVDTGGWYKICCPTSQLVKPDVLGAIYRVRKVGAPKIEDPLGKKIAWKKLSAEEQIRLLDDPRVFVKRQTIELLSKRGKEFLEMLMVKGPFLDKASEKVWSNVANAYRRTLIRLPLKSEISMDGIVDIFLKNEQLITRGNLEGLARWVSCFPMQDQAKKLQWVTRLLDQIALTSDPWMEHSLIYALIQLEAREATIGRLNDSNPRVRRAALTALDQMEGGKLEAKWVVADLDSSDPKLRATAWWIVSRHPEWGADVAQAMRKRLVTTLKASAQEREEFVGQFAQLSKSKAIQELLADSIVPGKTDSAAAILALRVMARAPLKEAPSAWLNALAAVLTSKDQDLLREAAATTRALRLPKQLPAGFAASLRAIGASPDNTPVVRLTALTALPGGVAPVEEPLFAFLLEQLKTEQPAAQRSLAAEVLSKAKLESGQLVLLTGAVKTVSPLELDRLLDAFSQSKDDKVGQSLLDALQTKALRPALRVDMVKTRLAKFGPEIRKRSESLLQALNADLGKQQARLEELLGQIKGGDIARGQIVFNSQKTACMVCHAIGYVGGKVGPDLTRIGGIRSERDLLEAIVFPSASFVRSYEPIVVVTTGGKAHNGLVKRDNADELVLVTGPNQEVRIARAEIEEIHPGRVSIMPSGLDQQLSISDLADLIAFLKACK